MKRIIYACMVCLLIACSQDTMGPEYKALYKDIYKTCTKHNLNEAYCTKSADLVIHYFDDIETIEQHKKELQNIVLRVYVPVEMTVSERVQYAKAMDRCMLSDDEQPSIAYCRCQVGMWLYPFDEAGLRRSKEPVSLEVRQKAKLLCPLFQTLDKPNLFGF